MKARLAIAILVCVGVVVLALTLSQSSASDTAAPQEASISAPAIPPQQPAPAKASTDTYKDTSMLKPPAGSPFAIVEFEDMECPLCAHDFPLVRAASEQYKVPLVRHDFPLTEIHAWALAAAVTARYIQDTISPALAEQFRRDIFANQRAISNKDDLVRFTGTWFASHHRTLPFVMDSSGACRQEVLADRALGDRMGLHHTPCLMVVTQTGWIEITDIAQLDRAIETAVADARKRSA